MELELHPLVKHPLVSRPFQPQSHFQLSVGSDRLGRIGNLKPLPS